jgi:hypothetical protein
MGAEARLNEVISSIPVGLVTGRGVSAPPAHPNLKPQIAAFLLRVLQMCSRSSTPGGSGAKAVGEVSASAVGETT